MYNMQPLFDNGKIVYYTRDFIVYQNVLIRKLLDSLPCTVIIDFRGILMEIASHKYTNPF